MYLQYGPFPYNDHTKVHNQLIFLGGDIFLSYVLVHHNYNKQTFFLFGGPYLWVLGFVGGPFHIGGAL